ncbi:hypothetical protein G4Y73_09775 [Wenzhouxiangella sp. XN201]|uniref:hypothetical protein n=1 Tax=Wenzhouxiangella sp. XN201 TaxID=2710755 RepID=UPI0013CCA6E4|nr:hypothetical protein [Wenzhouxiangella sp. XN201]NEZ04434.1 hypothetical protein [Wenzhouxiangella sp. XN201]
MSKLADLLIDLGKNADLKDAYESDPKEVMARYGLSDEEMQAMLEKDLDKIKKLSGLDNLKSNGNVHAYDS